MSVSEVSEVDQNRESSVGSVGPVPVTGGVISGCN
jgi:hypothetical protein